MTDLSPYIKQLLYRNDCVILPTFGGIMAQYASAQVHPIQNVFTPPHKTLAFNKSLTHNDGLLVSEIVRYTGVTYEAASVSIHQFVRKIESDLSGKGQAVIAGVGKFFYDVEHNLIFESFEENNYLANAFGFDRFIAKPVMRREEVIHQLENAAPKKKSRSRFGWAGLGVLLALLLISLQIINVSNDFKPFQIGKSDFWKSITSVFSSEKKDIQHTTVTAPTYHKDTLVVMIQQPVATITENSDAITTPVIDSIIGRDSLSVKISSTEVIRKSIANSIALAYSTMKSEVAEGNKYYLVFACLKSQSRTDKFIQQMKDKGIDVSVLMQDNYIRIGQGGFNTSEEALDSMRNYHAQGLKDVWVMKR